jgi:two-component system, OmpR family, sensor histidine kinase MtrB
MSLHRSLSLFVIGLASLALTAAIALIVLTNHLHRTTLELENGLHSVRLAEEMQIDLLTYLESRDAITKANAQGDLRQKLTQAREFVSTPGEAELLAEANRLVQDHFSRDRQPGSSAENDGDLERTFLALRQFVNTNVQQADESLRESARWDDIADWIGFGVSTVLLAGMGMMLVWLRMFAFRPVFEIRNGIKDFATGRKGARIPERGPEELRSIAAAFNSMASALERQYENQLSFLAGVAHDLRNPVGALKMSAGLLSSNRAVSLEKVSDLMEVIKRQVDHLDRMVGDLLDATRIETGRLELRLEEIDARKIVQAVFDLFSPVVSRGHQVSLNLPDEPVTLKCDPLRIEQVLNNLLSNAIKYSPHGGNISFGVEASTDEVIFYVSDQGLGIAEGEVPYIFEPFRRAVGLKDNLPGAGLGLSVARRIVQGHGGRIDVETQLNKGTTFRVRLRRRTAAVRFDQAV